MMDDKKKERKKDLKSKLNSADNSSMAQNLDEIKKLGKEMEQEKTNKELREENLIPDPKQ